MLTSNGTSFSVINAVQIHHMESWSSETFLCQCCCFKYLSLTLSDTSSSDQALGKEKKEKKTSLSPNPSVKWSTHLVKHTYLCGGNSRCSWARSILLTTCPVHLHLLSSHQYTACNTTASLNHAQKSWERTSTEILKNRHQSHICIADIKQLLTAVGYNAFVLR